jgi:ElaB/YqjD/DUF883 family membrane-anchored ribosome-binding protein
MSKQDIKIMNDALELLNEAAHGQKKEFTSLVTDKFSDLKKGVHDLESDVSDGASEGLEWLKSLPESAMEHTKSSASHVDRKVHESPWKTLGWTVVAAFAAGVLLGRRNNG